MADGSCNILRRGWTGLMAVLLSACTIFVAPQHYTTEQSLLENRGKPSVVWRNDDGTRTLVYATQPFGQTCWMYTVDAAGQIIAAHDALLRDNLRNVQPGLTMDAVRHLLGPEYKQMYFSLSDLTTLEWTIAKEWENRSILATRFVVYFRDEKVVKTEIIEIQPLDRGSL